MNLFSLNTENRKNELKFLLLYKGSDKDNLDNINDNLDNSNNNGINDKGKKNKEKN